MSLDISFLPNIKVKSTKDSVIKLLTLEKELTNKQIHNKIKKQFAISVSYQAVRQALTELIEQNVLKKEKKYYSLNIDWIRGLNDFSKLLYNKYIEKRNIKFIDENTTQVELNSLNDLGHFILYGLENYFFDLSKKGDLIMQLRHLWFPFSAREKRERLKEVFLKNRIYVLSKKKSIGDVLLSSFYKNYGKVKLGVKFDSASDRLVHGDCVADIFFPKKLSLALDKAYSLKGFLSLMKKSGKPMFKGILSFNIVERLTNLTYEENKIPIIITRNKEIAQRIRDETLKYFR